MKKIFFPLLLFVLLTGCEKPKFQSQDILVTGTAEPVISLNGTWLFTMAPPENFFLNDINTGNWKDISVPGECAMQGFAIKHNIPYAYKKQIDIPSDYSGKIIKIRFEGVYSYARVWVNGKFIRDHSGGFTAWECDITGIAEPGKKAWLTVEFTDKDDEMSYASGYAKHPIGGILRSVTLLAIPVELPEAVYVTTKLNHKFRNADLTIKIIKSQGEKSWVGFRMYDRKGSQVRLIDRRYKLTRDTSDFTFRVRDPAKWSAEDPALYTLVIEVFNESILTASQKTRFGFRDVTVVGNKLLVNGQEVKLRGACRHDIHPTLGRVSTPEYDLKDVLLAKEANMNYIRTSHYPPSESFLRYCDEYGLFVEDESAVCFVNTHRNRFYKELKQSGQEFLPQQLSQVKEMVMNHFNHPSVIIWSLGNESLYNEGFKTGYDFIKSFDATRPVMFSYPGSVPDSVKCYDILSLHYPSYHGDLSQRGLNVNKFSYADMPVIFDEWAHVPCYNKPELLEDMNVRNFWGQSLDSMWTGVFASDGGAGGAIWGMIDETFMLPDTMSGYNEWWGIQEESNGIKMYEGPAVGYGEWGIADTWRRKKPEFWNTKKAYSPVRIMVNEISSFKPGTPLEIPVYNRFDNTNLNDIITEWTYRGKTSVDRIWTIGPRKKGVIQLRASNWTAGETVNIRFLTRDSLLIDEYNLILGKKEIPVPAITEANFRINDTGDGKIIMETTGMYFTLNKKSGLLENLISGSDTIIRSGPLFNFRYPAGDHWSVMTFGEIKDKFIPSSVWYDQKGNMVNISVSGSYGPIKVNWLLTIKGDLILDFSYSAEGLPEMTKVEEAGLIFLTGNKFQSLNWERNSYWNAYPVGHPGAAAGKASLSGHNNNVYRQPPGSEWALDNSSFYYNGMKPSSDLSYLASSLKENIYLYNLSTTDNKGITVSSDGNHACRIKKEGNGYRLNIDRYWDYLSIAWGNYFKDQTLPQKFTDSFTLLIK
jgi:beta-galactosidase